MTTFKEDLLTVKINLPVLFVYVVTAESFLRGINFFVPGVEKVDGSFCQGDIVSIETSQKNIIFEAIGRTLFDSSFLKLSSSGKIVELLSTRLPQNNSSSSFQNDDEHRRPPCLDIFPPVFVSQSLPCLTVSHTALELLRRMSEEKSGEEVTVLGIGVAAGNKTRHLVLLPEHSRDSWTRQLKR